MKYQTSGGSEWFAAKQGMKNAKSVSKTPTLLFLEPISSGVRNPIKKRWNLKYIKIYL